MMFGWQTTARPRGSRSLSHSKKEEDAVAFVQRGEREQQKSSGGKNAREKTKETERVKAAIEKKKERTSKVTLHNCGKKGHYQVDCKQEKKEDLSISSDGSGIDQLNFDKFEDNESCKSGKNMFNLGEYED